MKSKYKKILFTFIFYLKVAADQTKMNKLACTEKTTAENMYMSFLFING